MWVRVEARRKAGQKPASPHHHTTLPQGFYSFENWFQRKKMFELSTDRVQTILKDAINRRIFASQIIYPDENMRFGGVSKLFGYPYVVWVPETRYGQDKGRPMCVNKGCFCVPEPTNYLSRKVHDTDHMTVLLYVRYKCNHPSLKLGGLKRRELLAKGYQSTFTTTSQRYFRSVPGEVAVDFPYVLSERSGISKKMMESFHSAMLQPKGLSPAIRDIITKRKSRYFMLKNRFCRIVIARLKQDKGFTVPSPPSMNDFMKCNSSPNRQSVQNLWMAYTKPYEDIAEAIMDFVHAEVCYRMDGTMKIGKKCFVVDEKNKQVNPKSVKVLMLVINEIGQWKYFGFREEEDKTSVKEALMCCRKAQEKHEIDREIAVIVDNAEAYRKTIKCVFDRVSIRQDPFHVIDRFNRYAHQDHVGECAKRISAALYKQTTLPHRKVRKELRSKKDMHQHLLDAVVQMKKEGFFQEKYSKELEGTLNNNLKQILAGDLSPFSPEISETAKTLTEDEVFAGDEEMNDTVSRFEEACLSNVSISTSQVEGENSRINALLGRRVKMEVLLRILKIYSIYVNIRQGVKHGRIPANVEHSNVLELFKTAILCRGVLAVSEEEDWASEVFLQMIQNKEQQLSGRIVANEQLLIRANERFYPVESGLFERFDETSESVEEEHPPLKKQRLMDDLFTPHTLSSHKSSLEHAMDLSISRSSEKFSLEEKILLREVRSQQLRFKNKYSWSVCALVTSFLYNRACSNQRNCAQKSLQHVAAQLGRDYSNIQIHRCLESFEDIFKNCSMKDVVERLSIYCCRFDSFFFLILI